MKERSGWRGLGRALRDVIFPLPVCTAAAW